jgi:hypothetical protein
VIVFLNGAFGVGKTSVAHTMVRLDPRFRIVDPERLGWLLSRVPVLGRCDDFQELPAWRAATTWHVAAAARRGRRWVLVPMAFSELATMNEIAAPLARVAPVVRVCLVARLETIRARLEARGLRDEEARAWAWRRSAECVAAHRDERFGLRVETEGQPVDDVARRVLALVR